LGVGLLNSAACSTRNSAETNDLARVWTGGSSFTSVSGQDRFVHAPAREHVAGNFAHGVTGNDALKNFRMSGCTNLSAETTRG